MAKRCTDCGTVYMDTEAHSCEAELASRRKATEGPGWTEGSFATGIALGLFLGLLGVLVGHLTKQRATRQGALYGLLGRLVIAFVAIAFAVVFDGS